MKKLKVAIIGQGRSGRDIHGVFFRSAANDKYEVKYVVEADAERRARAEKEYAGCKGLANYGELFEKDVDLVVNASYSDMHFSITKDLLEHGKNVLVEKPFARNFYECETLINASKKSGALLAVFQNTFYAPFYEDALKIAEEKKPLGEIKQVSIRYNAFARRWDWQTLQKKMGGSVYNTGPHPIGLAMGFLGFSPEMKVAYSKLDTAITSGDAEDYVKIILTAPGKPVVDIEINSIDAYSDYNLKLQGTKGTMKSTPQKFERKYIIDGENPEKPVIEASLKDETGLPIYCTENLKMHEEKGEYQGTAFDVGTRRVYDDVYFAITEKKPLGYPPETIEKLIEIIETVHAGNPLPIKF